MGKKLEKPIVTLGLRNVGHKPIRRDNNGNQIRLLFQFDCCNILRVVIAHLLISWFDNA
ncbi:hypothetical protein BDGGKGIB_00098 [Nodularia sphaerocarpa UHCC 0038]|nr:hypothetical protein BDGGKGIB_00098 [Nodularia sphaerocarpa UHCC 0038]